MDKWMHFGGGIVLAVFGAAITFVPIWASALLLSIAAGIGKELWDKATGRGTPEILDAVATIVGGSIVSVILYVVM